MRTALAHSIAGLTLPFGVSAKLPLTDLGVHAKTTTSDRGRTPRRRGQQMPEKELTHDATDSYSIRNPPSGAPDPQVVDSIREAAATSFLAVAGTDRLRVTAWAALADLAARTAARLSTRAARSAACEARYPIDVIDELTIDQRIAIGDREALYDAIREAQGRLDDIANRIDLVLTDGRHLAACHAVRQSKQEARRTDSPRNGVAAEPPCLTEE